MPDGVWLGMTLSKSRKLQTPLLRFAVDIHAQSHCHSPKLVFECFWWDVLQYINIKVTYHAGMLNPAPNYPAPKNSERPSRPTACAGA